MRNLGIVVLGAALAGCASSSADIALAYVSPVAYQSYTGGLITAGEQCAYAVDACVKPRS
jgi:hypothetical protein